MGRRLLIVATVAAVLPASAMAAPRAYVLKGQYCNANYVGRWVKVRERRHGKWVRVKRVECVHTNHPTVTFYWCSPYPTNQAPYATTCSTDASTKGNPANPFKTTVGTQVSLDGYFGGSLQSDISPQGYITFAISGPSGASYTASWFDMTRDTAVQGCSQVYDNNGTASGTCDITFNTPGTYRITLSFTDTDRTYPNAKGPVEEVVVS